MVDIELIVYRLFVYIPMGIGYIVSVYICLLVRHSCQIGTSTLESRIGKCVITTTTYPTL